MKIAALGFVLAVVGAAQAQITIDDFTSGPDTISVTSGLSYYEQSGSMLGGHRTESLNVLSNPFTVPLDIDINHGFASVNEGADMTSDVSVGYGYTASSDHSTLSTFDLGANLSSANAFVLNVAFNQDAMTADIMLNNDASHMFAFNVAAASSPAAYTVDFSHFAGVDFSHIHQISVDFQDSNSNDFVLSSFVAAPEPVSMTFLGLGVVGLIARRRKS